jgi:hypothetical protein
MANRFQAQVSYAYSKTLLRNVNAHFYTPSRSAHPEDDRGPSLADLRHRFAVSSVFDLPWGIIFSTIVEYTGASPFRVRAATDLDGDAQLIEDRPVGLPINQGGVESQANLDIINQFRRARRLTEVTLEQLARQDRYFTVDLRANKTFGLPWWQSRIEVMAEVYNLFNRTNFNNPNGTMTSVSFLTVSGTGPAREGRLGLRFRF